MKLVVVVKGAKELIEKLKDVRHEMRDIIARGLGRAAAMVAGEAKRIVYSGHPGHLEGDTGRLRQSIGYTVERQAAVAVIGSNVIYAAIHEFGGTIRPKEKAALAFQIDDRWVVVQSVQMPARPYLQPALESKEPAVAETLANTLYEALMP